MKFEMFDFYKNSIETTNGFFLCLNHEGSVLFSNDLFLKKVGINQTEISSHKFFDFLEIHDQEKLKTAIDEICQNHHKKEIQFKIIAKDHHEIAVEAVVKYIKNLIDENHYIVLTMTDISEFIKIKSDLDVKNKLKELQTKYLKKIYETDIAHMEDQIQLLLRELGEFFDVDRAYVFEYLDELQVIKNTYEWCHEGITPTIDDQPTIDYQDFIEWKEIHQKGLPIFINNVYEISRGFVRDLLISQKIKSLITYPMMNHDHCFGFIGFDSVRNHRNYSIYEQDALNEFSQLFLYAKQKVELQKQLISKENEIINQKERLSNLLNSSSDMILEVDINKRYVAAYGKSIYDHGFDIKNHIGKTPTEVFGKEGIYREVIYDKALSGIPQSFEGIVHCKNGDIWVETKVSPIYDINHQINGAVAISRNITEKKKKELEIIHMNHHDYLTGLHNRRYFNEYLKLINHSKHHPIGLIMMDLNGLKLINDVFGHEKGDQLLKKISKTFLKVINHENIFRIGGDEFVVIIKQATKDLMESYVTSIKQQVDQISIEEVKISIGIGYAIKEHKTSNFNEIINQAESNMYLNKMIHGKNTKNKAIMSILKALTEKNHYEKEHSIGVAKYVKLIGKEMNFSKDQLRELEMAGLLHDIGKISISDQILLKKEPLTEQEFEMIKAHTEFGYQILRIADEYSNFAEYALSHHEKYDGSGYPSKLKGEEIPLFSRIISVADAYEAMTSSRPFRESFTKAYAKSELIKCSGTQFDPKIVKCFLKVLNKENNAI
jgi:diguanylate cyclase (GGDEF)-like protein/PAS domain S-box-containing protein